MVLLLPSAFLVSLAVGIVNFAMLFIVKERFGASAQEVGAFTALGSMAYFVGCLSLKGTTLRIGPRASMAIMNLGTACLLGLFLIIPSKASAFVIYAAYDFLCALFWPPLMAWISSGLEGSRLGKATSLFSLSWSAGGTVAPYLGGILAEIGLSLAVEVGLGICALTGIFILATRKSIPTPQVAASDSGPAAEDRSTPLRYPAWIGLFLVYAVLGVFFNIFPVFAKDELALSESKIGLILLIRALFAAIGFWALGRFEFWHFRRRFIVLAMALLFMLNLVFIPVRAPLGFGFCLAALGLIQALSYNSSVFYGASGARDRAKRMTINEALLTAGQIVGSIAGGLVYQHISWASIFIFLAALVAMGLAGQILLLRRRS
jgi:DHA1 family multidrug resistance protein-like MFS transporter/DHA1 family quinolone resistance protein-like MFS transporter